MAAFVLGAVGPDSRNGPLPATAVIGVILFAGLWPAASIHALWVNFESRLPLFRT